MSKLDTIKEEIAQAKERKMRAEMKLDDIESGWKSEFNVDNLEDAEALLDKMLKSETSLRLEYDELMSKLEEKMESIR